MEHIPQLVVDLALILAVAAVATIICRRFKQPLVLGYVLAGFLVSPAIGFFPSVGDTSSIDTWSELGVIFLMFGLGLEFSFTKLATVGKPAIITALVEMLLMILLGFGVGTALGWSFYTSIFLGGMLAVSSTTIIIKAFDDLGLKGKKFSNLVFGALVMEDIGAIFMMVILSTIAVGSSVDGAQIAIQLGQMALYLVIWFVLSIIIIPTVLQKVAKTLTDEIILVTSIALCMLMVVLANAIGFSAALGAFIAGSILAGTKQAHRIEKLFKPVKDLFGAIFFVSVGMLVSPSSIVDNIGAIAIVTVVTLIGKPIASTAGALFSGQDLKTSLQTGLSLSQIGEFSFIIAALGVTLGVTDDFLYPVIIAVSVVTTLTTPFYIKNADRVYLIMVKILPKSLVSRIDQRAEPTEEEKEGSAWGNYIKHWLIKVIMVVIAAVASVEVFSGLLKPLMTMAIPENIADHILTALSLLITGIFIANLFQSARKGDFMQLWTERKRHRLPLIIIVVIGFLISAGMIIYIVLAFENGSPWWIAPALIATLFLARSKTLHSWFLQLETRFVGNLNENILQERTADRSTEDRIEWTEDHLFVTEVKITQFTERRGKQIPLAYGVSLACNLDIIAIKRKNEFLYQDEIAHATKEELRHKLIDASDSFAIEMDDVITFVGSEEEIDAFNTSLIKRNILREDDSWKETLREYLNDEPQCGDLMCFSLRIDPRSAFRNKTISNINFKGSYGCLVIAMERKLLPVIKPSGNTRLAQNDLVLMLGTRHMAEYFKTTTNEFLVTPLAIADSDIATACEAEKPRPA